MVVDDGQCANQQQQHDYIIRGNVTKLVIDEIPGNTDYCNAIEPRLNGVTYAASSLE
ncbi:hypothetical protein D3C80_897970 [compost metagenome]